MLRRRAGKPGWFFGATLCFGIVTLAVLLHFLVGRPLGWGDVIYAIGYSVVFTLFRRAVDRLWGRASHPPTEDQDTP